MLLGNKSDLHNLRDVAEESASIKAEELGIPYLETSALEGSNVEAAFESIIDVVFHFSMEGGASKIMLAGEDEEANGQPLLAGMKLDNSFLSDEKEVKLKSEDRGCVKGRCCG